MGRSYTQHHFYCMNCGHEGIPLMRKECKRKEKFHRKKLYCPYCKCEVNHIECKNEEEQKEFLSRFRAGEYQQEAVDSLIYLRGGD